MLDLVRRFLEDENYLVEVAANYREGLDKIVSFDYDCILLDIMLPDGNGLSLLQELRKQNKADSVIILSAKDSIEDRVRGLDLGADDYLCKPFHIAELNARIKSVIRRRGAEGDGMLRLENLEIKLEERLVMVDDRVMELNRKEFDILVFMALNRKRITSKPAIAENIWGDHLEEADGFDFIYSQIKNLRKKLRENRAAIDITSVYGMGYKLSPR